MGRRAVTCPHCGEDFRAGRRSCPHCGSDAGTGWSEDAELDALELPETSLDDEAYADLLGREGLGPARGRNRRGLIVLLIVLAFLLPVLFVLYLALRR